MGDPSYADFTEDVTSGTVPLTVNFTDTSFTQNPIIRWDWDFENDGTIDSHDQNPTHIYSSPGTYSVSLTIETDIGQTYNRTYLDLITVSGIPLPIWDDGGPDHVVLSPTKIAYVDQDTPDNNYGGCGRGIVSGQGFTAPTGESWCNTLLQFNISAVENFEITKMELLFHVYDSRIRMPLNNNVIIFMILLDEDFIQGNSCIIQTPVPGEVTWNNQPSHTISLGYVFTESIARFAGNASEWMKHLDKNGVVLINESVPFNFKRLFLDDFSLKVYYFRPYQPLNVTAIPYNGKIRVDWNTPEFYRHPIEKYNVYKRLTLSGQPFMFIGSTVFGTNTFYDEDVKEDDNYHYAVTSYATNFYNTGTESFYSGTQIHYYSTDDPQIEFADETGENDMRHTVCTQHNPIDHERNRVIIRIWDPEEYNVAEKPEDIDMSIDADHTVNTKNILPFINESFLFGSDIYRWLELNSRISKSDKTVSGKLRLWNGG